MGMSGYLKDQENISSQDRRTLKMEHLTYLKTYAQFKKKKKKTKFPEETD